MAHSRSRVPFAAGSLLTAGLSISITVGSVQAQDVDERLNEMQREIEALRNENQAMRGEIGELRAQTGENWLTEARAREIRGLVHDVLTDADQRASLLDNGAMAGWNEHFYLASPDGRFKLVLEGQEQIRWIYNYQDAGDRHRHGFENTRTRLVFRGHVFSPDLTYYIRSEYARQGGGNTLLDAWVRYHLNDDWSLRFGQFKLPFNREELVSSSEQLAVERSLVNELLNIGRSQGVELTYVGEVDRVSIAYSDGGSPGLANTAGGARFNTTALTEDNEYNGTVRYERLLAGSWSQFNDFTSPQGEEFGLMLGFAAHHFKSEANNAPSFSPNETSWTGLTADASAEWGGANAFLAFTYHYVDNPGNNINFFGVVLQGGFYITPKWELFARGEYGWLYFNGPHPSDLTVATIGFNYYIDGHDVKWTTDFGVSFDELANAWNSDLAGYRTGGPGAVPQVVIRTQFQLLF